MPVIRLNANDKTITLRKSTNAITLKQVGRRGLQGPQGDPGDPGVVQSVNGQSIANVVLDHSDVGADPAGSASQALADAKDYTDSEVSTLDSSLATVAKTGSYDDLSDKPTIPSIAGLATETYVDNAVAPKANTSDLGTAAFEDVEDLPVSTATQSELDGKVDKVTTVNTLYGVNGSGNQASYPISQASDTSSIAQRSSGGTLAVGTPTANAHATTKAYVDAADALKVNKSGDTMTGSLITMDIRGATASTHVLGTSSNRYWAAYLERVYLGSSNVAMLAGTGFPNGVVSAPVGSTYIDTAATNGAIEWKKATGTGTTGWVVSVGDTGWRKLSSWGVDGIISGDPLPSGYKVRDGFRGAIQIRRVGFSVEWRITGIEFTAPSPPYPIPAGFGVIPYYKKVPTMIGTTAVYVDLGGSHIFVAGGTGQAVGSDYGITVQYETTLAYPTTLPGTAV